MNNYYKPGCLEVYVGPMKSGKTKKILDRIDKLKYIEGIVYKIFVPVIDTRNKGIESRYGISEDNVITVNDSNDIISENCDVYILDELQFFYTEILDTIKFLLNNNKHVICAGLNMDFRGETFGNIGNIMAIADKIYNCNGICEICGCNNLSTHTQRLINGKPAPYDSPTILVGDETEGYETRCRKHHQIKKYEGKINGI